MGTIQITKIRIENFRSIEHMELDLSAVNVLIGANNAGKSNFLKAVNIALSQSYAVSDEDIFVGKDEILDKKKVAIIDVMFRPFDDKGHETSEFSEFWIGTFGEGWITNDSTNGDFVGIRTSIQFDILRNDYVLVRRRIIDWGKSASEVILDKRRSFTRDMNNYLFVFYMDAQRDVVEDLRDRKSYFGKATSRIELLPTDIQDIESQLNEVNVKIVDSIPALRQTADRIGSIASTIGSSNGTIEIEPLARKVADLHKGMDIFFKDGEAARLSISQHGMGIRSWISFLTLGAYVDWEKEALHKDDEEADSYAMLTMEEPEAHLHPQAQQQLYSQLCGFTGQKIISTHSPSVVSQSDLTSLIHFEKSNGRTIANRFDVNIYSGDEDINKIRREVISSRGELLFANAVVLCEGVTEQQALPIFFEDYFGFNPTLFGINIIGIGGRNYKTFLNLIQNFNIPWFVFSDGEEETVKIVNRDVQQVFGFDASHFDNVIILDGGYNYEKHLLKSGYLAEIISAINSFENNENYIQSYITKRNHKPGKRIKTAKQCPTCGQAIYESQERDYDVPDGLEQAVYDCMTDNSAKAKYAICVAERITHLADVSRRIPPKILELLNVMSVHLNLRKRDVYESLTRTADHSES